jgi:Tfp pilus assembly protein PilV
MPKARSVIKGFSIVEVLLAASIFALLVTALTGAFLYGQENTALAGARARAGQLADEGLESSRSIRDNAFANLTDGSHGLALSGGVWTYSGAQDVTGQFTRSVIISTIDANTKELASTVTWQQNTQRTGTVSAITRLTSWATANALAPGGLLIYGDGTMTPKYRTYNTTTNTFSAEAGALVASSGQTFTLRTSPTKTEAIAGYVTSAGVLNVLCFNGTTWTQEWSATVGGTGTTRRFDIAYETATGNAVVLFSRNVAATNELAYRTKLGSSGCGVANWADAALLNPLRTSGVVQWVKMAWDRRAGQNLITAIWADANSDLSAIVWNGSAWGNEPTTAMTTTLEVVAIAQDVEDFDVEYETLSGDVMVMWSNAAAGNTVRYRACTGGIAACTWGAITTPPTFADDATNLDISANPNTDQLVFASVGNAQSDLQIGYWSGSAWTNRANVDTTAATPLAGTKLVSTGWLISGATTRSIVVYNDAAATNIGYYVGSAGTFTVQTDFTPTPAFANPQKYYQVEMNPLSKDQLMFSLSDNLNDLYSKRLIMTATPTFTWTNADGAALETTLPQAITSPFAFSFWRM